MYLFECFVAYTNMIHVWIFYLSSPAFWHHRMKCDKRTSGLIQQAFRACRHYKNPLKLYISKLAAKQQSYNPICFGLALLVSNAIRTSVNCMLMFCQPHPPPHLLSNVLTWLQVWNVVIQKILIMVLQVKSWNDATFLRFVSESLCWCQMQYTL